MWARVVEFTIGCWMAMSPFIFRHSEDEVWYWIIDFSAALLIMLLAVLSYWHPLRHAHLGQAAVALALVVIGRFALSYPIPPAGQNYILVGLVLGMFAFIPNWASQPPGSWMAREVEPS